MTAFNPQHYRKTWAALGNPTDPVAFDVAGPQSAISLLKGILAEFGFPFIPAHSISFDKLQQVVGPTVLGRGAGLGDVFACTIGRGIQISTFNQVSLVPDVPMKSEANIWLGQNTFQNPVRVPDGVLGLSIYSVSDLSKQVQFDLATMPAGNTLTVHMPTVGLGAEIGYLALLKTGNSFAQPLDDDLTSLSSLTAINTMYYRSQDVPAIWSPVVIGAGLLFNQGTLSATGGGGGGGGGVSTAGPVNASMLTAYADATGNLIQGVMVSGPGITYASGLLQTTGDLLALENLTGTNTIYYRVADATWNPVVISNGLIFTSGALAVNGVLQAFAGLNGVADTVPYYSGTNTLALTAFTAFGRSLAGAATAAAALTLLGAQPLDGDLTAIANLAGTNTIYYRSGTSAWSPVTIGANLTFAGGTLAATGGGGGGVSTSGPVTSAMLTGYADATGLLIRGVTLPGAGITLTGAAMTLANDLSALEALSGTNNIYYRSGVDTWSPVVIGTNLTFVGGTLNATAAGGGVTTSGAVTSAMMTGYADSTGNLIRGINMPAAGISLSGNNMVLTGDLASLEAASATGAIYYRSAADTWSTVTIGFGLGFTTGTLAITNIPLVALGNVGTLAADRLPYFTGTTTAALATFTAAGRTLVSQPDAASMVGVLGAQPLDGDLTSLSGATGTNTIYYRSAANTWSPVVVGTNLTFAGGTLAATGGGGDVFKNLANTFTAQNAFVNVGVVIGNATPIHSSGLELQGTDSTKAGLQISEWSNDVALPNLSLNKSRGAAVGTHTIVQVNDALGAIYFNGSSGTAYTTLAAVAGYVGASVANTGRLSFLTHNGTAFAERMRLFSSGGLAIGTLVTDPTSGGLICQSQKIMQTGDTTSNGLTLFNAGVTVQGNILVSGLNFIFNNINGTPVQIQSGSVLCGNFAPNGCSILGNNGTADQTTGFVGEFVESIVNPSAGLTAGVYNICHSMSVPAGDWELRGCVRVSGTASSYMYINISANAAGSTGSCNDTQTGLLTGLADCWTNIGPVRVRVTAPVTYYLNCYMGAAGTLVQAIIQRRRRN